MNRNLKFLAVLILGLATIYASAQQAIKPPVVHVPDAQSKQLKMLDDWINARYIEYQTQRLLAVKDACLSLKMDLEQCNAVDIVPDEAGGYRVQSKPAPSPEKK